MRSKDFLESIAGLPKQGQADAIAPELARIKADLKAWKARHEMGEDGDAEWYRNASLAAKMMGLRYNQLLLEISAEKKAARKASASAYESAFIAAARRRLTPEAYGALCEEAREAINSPGPAYSEKKPLFCYCRCDAYRAGRECEHQIQPAPSLHREDGK